MNKLFTTVLLSTMALATVSQAGYLKDQGYIEINSSISSVPAQQCAVKGNMETGIVSYSNIFVNAARTTYSILVGQKVNNDLGFEANNYYKCNFDASTNKLAFSQTVRDDWTINDFGETTHSIDFIRPALSVVQEAINSLPN